VLFTELIFWAFFAIVCLAYVLLPHKAQNRMLLVASYIFYGAWDWRFLSLILLSTVIDYLVGLRLERENEEQRRRHLLWISLGANLGMLAIFKYFGFFIDSFQSLISLTGYEANPFTLSIVLPVGISFFTFQTLSYTIDIYRRDLKPTRDFFDFALFVAFFPQLVAGPIERAKNLLPNIEAPRILTWDNFRRGAVLEAYRDALVAKDLVAAGTAFAENSLIFENGKAEGSWAHYAEHHLGPELGHFQSFSFPTYEVEIEQHGHHAFGVERYTYRIELTDGRVIEREGVATSALMHGADGWKIIRYHSSSRAPRS